MLLLGRIVTNGTAPTLVSVSLFLGVYKDSGKGSHDLTAELLSPAQIMNLPKKSP